MDLRNLDNKKIYIAPSLLAADLSQVNNEIGEFDSQAIKILHFDIMDGHFVPNISFGPGIINSLKKNKGDIIFDAHLMIINPQKYIKSFKEAGCDNITFHYESVFNQIDEMIKIIRNEGLSVGISIKPKTKVEVILPYLPFIDLVLIMTVEPGFGGQKFIDFSNKISVIRKAIVEQNLLTHIQVDGGINAQTSKIVRQAGANILVAGTNFFCHPKGQKIALKELFD